jgi:hypothetical protein
MESPWNGHGNGNWHGNRHGHGDRDLMYYFTINDYHHHSILKNELVAAAVGTIWGHVADWRSGSGTVLVYCRYHHHY